VLDGQARHLLTPQGGPKHDGQRRSVAAVRQATQQGLSGALGSRCAAFKSSQFPWCWPSVFTPFTRALDCAICSSRSWLSAASRTSRRAADSLTLTLLDASPLPCKQALCTPARAPWTVVAA